MGLTIREMMTGSDDPPEDDGQTKPGDPFANEDTEERSAFVVSLNALAKTTVRRFPGGGERPDEERRRDELAIAEACAAVCLAAGWPDGARTGWAQASRKALREIKALREQLAVAEAAIESARSGVSERWIKATGALSPEGAAKRREETEEERDVYRARSGQHEKELAAWVRCTGQPTPGDADALLRGLEKDRAELRARVADLEAEQGALRERLELAQSGRRVAEEVRAAVAQDWRSATGFDTPEMARARIGGYAELIAILRAERDDAREGQARLDSGWREERAEDRAEIASLRSLVAEQNAEWIKATGAQSPEGAANWLEGLAAQLRAAEVARDSARSDVAALREKLSQAQASHEIAAGRYASAEASRIDGRARIDQLEREVAMFRKATASQTPAEAQDRAALRSRVAELERELAESKGQRARVPKPAPPAASGLRRADEPDTLAAIRRDFAAELQRRDGRLEGLLADVVEVQRQIEAFREEGTAPAAAAAWDPIGGRPIDPDPVAASREALRKEVAALCDAAGWGRYARRLRDGGEASADLLRLWISACAAVTPAEREALDALRALADNTSEPPPVIPAGLTPQNVGAVREALNAADPLGEAGARRERAAVVAWLRRMSGGPLWLGLCGGLATRLELGEHLPKASPAARQVAAGSVGPGTPEEQDRHRACLKNALHPLQAAGLRCSCGYEGCA